MCEIRQDAVQNEGGDRSEPLNTGGIDPGALDNLATGTTTVRDHRGVVRPGAFVGLTKAERHQLSLRYELEELDPLAQPVVVEAVLCEASGPDGVLRGGPISRMSARQWAALLDEGGIDVEAALEALIHDRLCQQFE